MWSCGIILYVLLLGNTPWAEPTEQDEEFVFFVQNYANLVNSEPWNSLPSPCLRTLLLGLLNPDQEARMTSQQVIANAWFQLENQFLNQDFKCVDPAGNLSAELRCRFIDVGLNVSKLCAWQPIHFLFSASAHAKCCRRII